MTLTPSQSAQRSYPRISARDAKFATVLVGADNARFVVHKDLLTYHSEFFRAALDGKFKEAEEKTVTLADEDEDIFEFFVHWLYHQKFPAKSHGHGPDLVDIWKNTGDGGYLICFNLVKLYVFGDKYMVPQLKLEAFKDLMDYIWFNENFSLLGVDLIRYAFDRAPADGGLCRFLVDAGCRYYPLDKDKESEAQQEHLPHAYLLRVMRRYQDFQIAYEPDWFEDFDFHKQDYHPDD